MRDRLRKLKNPLLVIICVAMFAFLVKKSFDTYTFRKELESAEHLESIEIIPLPLKEGEQHAFTCTGLFYDEKNDTFLVGNAGKDKPDDEVFQATIEVLSPDFSTIVRTLLIYPYFPNLGDIQGVTVDKEGEIWFCSPKERLVRSIDADFNEVRSIRLRSNTGITYDSRNDSIWILTSRKLVNYSKEGELLASYRFKRKAQDQLYLDESANEMYITTGADYHGPNFVYKLDLDSRAFNMEYVLEDSFAIEGISIVGDKMYILNDGYYHDAKVPRNQVNVYQLSNK